MEPKEHLKSKIAEFKAEEQFARNMADSSPTGLTTEIWETIESGFRDMVYKLNFCIDRFLNY